ncbi:MAG TPA: hypothetical protein V6D22_08005 [Candidatus Obscuribacterales bacterium]
MSKIKALIVSSLLSFALAAPAMQAAVEPADGNGPPSLFEDDVDLKTDHAAITVRLHTSRSKEAADTFTLYPYPVKPPTWTPPPPLPLTHKSIKNLCMASGYQNHINFEKPYSIVGWRWAYAYAAGVRKSGLGEPHTVFSEYSWADEVAPYVARECQVRNDFEKRRAQRYRKVCEEWERTHADAEASAVNQGLMPIALSSRHWGIGRGQFPAGNWWVQVTRKTPGVTYYWLEPITATAGQHLDITLDDDKALAIIGGW